jgi:menaquinone-dependent protoporphyrinogen oxidase
MKILVGVASKHGSTEDIANRVAERLRVRGQLVDVMPLSDGCDVEQYDVCVIGSAVYMGSWRKEARRFVDSNTNALTRRPVWLFSSGPLGDDAISGMPSDSVEHLEHQVAAVDHQMFRGRLDRDRLAPTERLVAAMVHAPAGDFRSWDDIDRWADSIADHLASTDVTK